MKRIKTDQWVIDQIFGKHINVACLWNIDPNSVTSVGLALSLTIGVLHVFKHYWWVSLFMILRQLCDLLDGPIARTCFRTSKLGGYFDTIADNIYSGTVIFVFLHIFFGVGFISIGCAILIPISYIIIGTLLYTPKVLYDHSQYAQSEEINFHIFLADNIFVTSFLTALIYLILIFKSI